MRSVDGTLFQCRYIINYWIIYDSLIDKYVLVIISPAFSANSFVETRYLMHFHDGRFTCLFAWLLLFLLDRTSTLPTYIDQCLVTRRLICLRGETISTWMSVYQWMVISCFTFLHVHVRSSFAYVELKVKLVALGGIETMIAAMSAHKDHAEIQRKGCSCLSNLIYKDNGEFVSTLIHGQCPCRHCLILTSNSELNLTPIYHAYHLPSSTSITSPCLYTIVWW